MVDVSHHHHDRRAGDEVLRLVLEEFVEVLAEGGLFLGNLL
jgi:hypothetical protein